MKLARRRKGLLGQGRLCEGHSGSVTVEAGSLGEGQVPSTVPGETSCVFSSEKRKPRLSDVIGPALGHKTLRVEPEPASGACAFLTTGAPGEM